MLAQTLCQDLTTPSFILLKLTISKKVLGQRSIMDRFRMIFQYFQTNSESVMNGICALLALASVKIYTSFDFNCPCLPKYNLAYGMGLMLIPPVVLFLCGLIVNRQSVVVVEEWKRPTGDRKKNVAIIRWGLLVML